MNEGMDCSDTGFPCTVFGASHSTSLEGSEHRTTKRIGPSGDGASGSQNETLPEQAACLFKPNSKLFSLTPVNRLLRAASRILSLRNSAWSRISAETSLLSAFSTDVVPTVWTSGANCGRMFLTACLTLSGSSVG